MIAQTPESPLVTAEKLDGLLSALNGGPKKRFHAGGEQKAAAITSNELDELASILGPDFNNETKSSAMNRVKQPVSKPAVAKRAPKQVSESSSSTRRERRSPSPRRRTARRRRTLKFPPSLVTEMQLKLDDNQALWGADANLRTRKAFSFVYMSKGKPVTKLPVLEPKIKFVKAPPDNELFMHMPREFGIDLNGCYYIPFTRYLYKDHQPSFVLEFDLKRSSTDGSTAASSFKCVDSSKLRVVETLTPFIVSNQAFECSGSVLPAAVDSKWDDTIDALRDGRQGRGQKKYRIFLVPQFVSDDVGDLSYLKGGVIDDYMQDYLKLNTEWSFAHPDQREKMKAGVTGVRFKCFVLPERELKDWAENWYQGTYEKKRLHLILDLDKTLIKAFGDSALNGINKLREDYHLSSGVSMPAEKKSKDGLPKELSGTNSFKIDFMFNGKRKDLWIKPRPFLEDFLREASKDYDISILSMGVPQYVVEVLRGLDAKYPELGVTKMIPPSRVMSSAYTISKFKKGTKDLRMLYPFSRFSDRRNAVVIVDDTMDVWKDREDYTKLVYPISRYEGLEQSEVPECFPEMRSSLEKCLKHLKTLKKQFYATAASKSSRPGALDRSQDSNVLWDACRKVKVADLFPEILKQSKHSAANDRT